MNRFISSNYYYIKAAVDHAQAVICGYICCLDSRYARAIYPYPHVKAHASCHQSKKLIKSKYLSDPQIAKLSHKNKRSASD